MNATELKQSFKYVNSQLEGIKTDITVNKKSLAVITRSSVDIQVILHIRGHIVN